MKKKLLDYLNYFNNVDLSKKDWSTKVLNDIDVYDLFYDSKFVNPESLLEEKKETSVDIDSKLYDFVIQLNKIGLKTKFCCAGHLFLHDYLKSLYQYTKEAKEDKSYEKQFSSVRQKILKNEKKLFSYSPCYIAFETGLNPEIITDEQIKGQANKAFNEIKSLFHKWTLLGNRCCVSLNLIELTESEHFLYLDKLKALFDSYIHHEKTI